MESILGVLRGFVSNSFESNGYDPSFGVVAVSRRPDLGQFQCNGSLAAAKKHHVSPKTVAAEVAATLRQVPHFKDITVAEPGFVNITLADDFLRDYVADMLKGLDAKHLCQKTERIVIDYGGANIAKPMHVGHLRSAIIGESLKRIARFLGHHVVGDVHLGDWGLQMGMVISELERRLPDLPYFATETVGPFPKNSPVQAEDLLELYPTANARCKSDPTALAAARAATKSLQEEQPGHLSLWSHIRDVSIQTLKNDYESIGIEFDLWLGESDTRSQIGPLIQRLIKDGYAESSDGATVIFVDQPTDKREIPPLILTKSDGASLYGTTDLATIEQRMNQFRPSLILYVVDKRQSDHFVQLFRAARKVGVAPVDVTRLEHIAFGTMNGKNGKPFKTREGGVMQLKDLVAQLRQKAYEKLTQLDLSERYKEEEKREIASAVGLSALKFGDLLNHPTRDYVFDLDRFMSFEGKTGPYILYTAVRIKSILRKTKSESFSSGPMLPPSTISERDVFLELAKLPDQLMAAFDNRSPQILCEYIFALSSTFTTFYHNHNIMKEQDTSLRSSWIELLHITEKAIELVANLLGFKIPERM